MSRRPAPACCWPTLRVVAGIGYFTTLFTQNFDPAKLLGLIACLPPWAIVLNAVVRRAESHFAKWRT